MFYEQSAKTMSGTSGILPPAIHAFAGDASEIFIRIIFRIIFILEKCARHIFRF